MLVAEVLNAAVSLVDRLFAQTSAIFNVHKKAPHLAGLVDSVNNFPAQIAPRGYRTLVKFIYLFSWQCAPKLLAGEVISLPRVIFHVLRQFEIQIGARVNDSCM